MFRLINTCSKTSASCFTPSICRRRVQSDCTLSLLYMFCFQARCFLDRCRAERGRALVHCEHGVNTSAAVCVAYLLLHRRFRLLEAVHFLKVQRRVILNNEAFVRQLVRYAKERGFLEDDETAVRVKREYKMDKTWQKAYTYDRPRALKY